MSHQKLALLCVLLLSLVQGSKKHSDKTEKRGKTRMDKSSCRCRANFEVQPSSLYPVACATVALGDTATQHGKIKSHASSTKLSRQPSGDRTTDILTGTIHSLRMPLLLQSADGILGAVDHRTLFLPSRGKCESVRFGVRTIVYEPYELTITGLVEAPSSKISDARSDQLYFIAAEISEVDHRRDHSAESQAERLGEVTLDEDLVKVQTLEVGDSSTESSHLKSTFTLSLKSTPGKFWDWTRLLSMCSGSHERQLAFTRSTHEPGNVFYIEQRTGPENVWTPVLRLPIRVWSPKIETIVDTRAPDLVSDQERMLGRQTYTFYYTPLTPFSTGWTIELVAVVSSAGAVLPRTVKLSSASRTQFAEYNSLESHFTALKGPSRGSRHVFQLFGQGDDSEQNVMLKLTASPDTEDSNSLLSRARYHLRQSNAENFNYGLDVRWRNNIAYVAFVTFTLGETSTPNIMSEHLVRVNFVYE